MADEADYPELERVTFERLAPQYAFLDASIGKGPWLLFGQRTIADAYLYMLARTADLLPDRLIHYLMLAAFRARLELDSGVIAHSPSRIFSERVARNNWLEKADRA